MKIIIAGGRRFSDYKELSMVCNEVIGEWNPNNSDPEIVSGTANGADRLGEKYANEKKYSIEQFPADWETNGRAAGYIRNLEMAKYSDGLIAFWDGKSKGTRNMINLAIFHSKHVYTQNPTSL